MLIDWLTELTDRHIPARPPMLTSMAMSILRSRDSPSFRQPGPTRRNRFISRYDEVKVAYSRQLD
jgi:hypothetical protein